MTPAKIRTLLIANRGEIAIRVMRAATELGIRTIAVYSAEDRFELFRTKADESYPIGAGKGPVEAYLDIPAIIAVAQHAGADAVHPGYGFLSENPDFAEACAAADLIFIGPSPAVMRSLGNKVSARNLAKSTGVAVMPATTPLPADMDACESLAAEVGYPLMLKASWGGGGRGMRVLEDQQQLRLELPAARREAKLAFGNDEVYLEKLIRRARHLEVQILGDQHGNLVHLFERDCTVQRRNQKVVERAPASFLSEAERAHLCAAALALGKAVGYVNAGTVEFLQDVDTGAAYFIEVNPRIQVEHTVTECATGIDLVKAQILIADGGAIGTAATGVPTQENIRLIAHALQCRVTTEDPENNFVPDQGKMEAYRSPAGFGVRLDAGTAYAGANVTRHYDSLLVKVTTWGSTPDDAIARMRRALLEFRIRGVSTNLRFLERVVSHPQFVTANYTTRFIDNTPALFDFPERRDRASRILTRIAHTIVNGNPQVAKRPQPPAQRVRLPATPLNAPPAGSRQLLDSMGADQFSRWLREQPRVLFTDTAMRDAHQSLLATRMRSLDMIAIAPYYASLLPQLFSVECWGGATFDVAMRFLSEDPWERLAALRSAMPNLLLQMLLRSANAVGYTNYPDNVVQHFVKQAASSGVDVFRIFDSLNQVDNMRVAMDAVRNTGKLCEAAICYTGNLLDPRERKYTLDYYLAMAVELQRAGAHILAIKDMGGLCQPDAARLLVTALRRETTLPLHFHTHDTSGIASASVLAAIGAGVDVVDGAIDSLSGQTSQPNLGSIIESLRHGPQQSELDTRAIRMISSYWEQVRCNYAAFESDYRAGTSGVYVHGMPGGQYTNLREQARALGIGDDRWHEVATAYADVNQLFGDIVKVTPTSKVVGDMAIMMVSNSLTPAQVADPDVAVSFPESVIQLFHGDLGQPLNGFPPDLQRKVLAGKTALVQRPGATLPPADLPAQRSALEAKLGRTVSDTQFASYLMYPRVFLDYAEDRRQLGNAAILPTTVFFYGMEPQQEVHIDIEKGKTLVVRYLAHSEPDTHGQCEVFFELNGQPRALKVTNLNATPATSKNARADATNPDHVGAPMPGLVTSVAVREGMAVNKGDTLLTLEAMKMETTIRASHAGTVAGFVARSGLQVEKGDLLVILAG